MASPFPRASIELDFPLYALDFDPEDSTRLFVGGGGGSGRSGVENKIAVLESSTQDELRVAGEYTFSHDEDSVMSLAVGSNDGKVTQLFAGVNSSLNSASRGQNHHLRTLSVQRTKSRASGASKSSDTKITELSRTALFESADSDTYQRLLRVANNVGAVASAMGKEHEIAIFDVPGAKARPALRGVMELPSEAQDMDIMQTAEKEFQLAWCYKFELYVARIGKQNSDPQLVFSMPEDHGERPVFRAIRYLTPEFILAVANLSKRSGALIQGFRLPAQGRDTARIAVSARIPRKISATAFAVTNLSNPSTPLAPIGDTQFVIAIAGHDSSLSLYTLSHQRTPMLNLLIDLYPLRTLKQVHGDGNITGVAFSRFITPKAHIRSRFLKLASISLQKTVIVHTIPLKKLDDKPRSRDRARPPSSVRYVVAMPSRLPSSRPLIFVLTLFVLIMAIVGQTVMELYGRSDPRVFNHFLPSWYGSLSSPNSDPPSLFEEFLATHLGSGRALKPGETMIVFEADPSAAAGEQEQAPRVRADVHEEHVHGPARTWDELAAEEKQAWRTRLHEAGAWTQGMGEKVLRGVLFGELAGAIGRAVGG